MFAKAEFTTSDLISPISKKADAMNHCTILINPSNGNYYSPNTKTIGFGFGSNVLSAVMFGDKLRDALDMIGFDDQESFKNEFTEHKIKGTIHHELTHWIDDTFNNRHIQKYIDHNVNNKLNPSFNDRNTHKLEVQGQIHNIAQLKLAYEDIWDIMSFEDMVSKSPVMATLYKRLRDIRKRMAREGLLGKNMNKTY
jgi:hypothetical protein